MATATKKPRESDAVSQLATMPERVAVVETKVDSMIVCIDEIKSNVKDMHDCLDNTRDMLAAKLEKMQDEYRVNSTKFFEHTDKLHEEDVATDKKLAAKIEDLEKVKSKYTMYAMVAFHRLVILRWTLHCLHMLKERTCRVS